MNRDYRSVLDAIKAKYFTQLDGWVNSIREGEGKVDFLTLIIKQHKREVDVSLGGIMDHVEYEIDKKGDD